jgi:membrane protein YdbS with pleckstrin-like domain
VDPLTGTDPPHEDHPEPAASPASSATDDRGATGTAATDTAATDDRGATGTAATDTAATDTAATDTAATDTGDGFQLLHPVAATLWRIGSVATALIVGGGATAIAFAVAGVEVVPLCLAAVTVVWTVFGWWFPQQRYRHWSYRIGDTALELRRGVWFRTSAAVPFHRIQQIDVEQGPIQRRSGVVTLRLRTAASMFLSEGTVPQLASDEADGVRARLLEAARVSRLVDDGH